MRFRVLAARITPELRSNSRAMKLAHGSVRTRETGKLGIQWRSALFNLDARELYHARPFFGGF
jgi:hypothetical protein